jgi:uncharacterized protein YhaN
MRIKGWHINGFGIFHDYSIDRLPGGLTVFHGPNEAGNKPHGEGYLYPPLNGGNHEGNITLDQEGKTITLERSVGRNKPPKITRSDDGELSEREFQVNVLGGADRNLFQSVFAFSLEELHSFSSLSNDEIGEGIVAAGIPGAGNSAVKVIKKLKEQSTEILAPQKSCILKRLVKDLKERKKELTEAQRAAEKYPDVLSGEEEIRNQIASLQGREKELEQVYRRFDTLKILWPAWNAIIEAEDSLRSLAFEGSSIVFVGESPSILLKGRLPEDELAGVLDFTAEHDRFSENYRANLQQLSKDKIEIRTVKANLEDKHEKLGPGWDEEKINRFDTSLPREAEVHSLEKEIDAAVKSYNEVKQEHVNAGEVVKSSGQACERLEKELEELDCRDESILEEKREALGRLRANRDERANLKRDFQFPENGLADIKEKVQTLENQLKYFLPMWPVFLTLGFSIAAFIAAVVLTLTGSLSVGILLFFLAVAGGITSRLFHLNWKKSKETEARLTEDLKRQKSKEESVKLVLDELNKSIVSIENRIDKDVKFLKLTGDVSLQQSIETLIANTDRQIQGLRTINARLKDARIKLEDAEENEMALAGALKEVQKNRIEVEIQWNDWVQSRGISGKLTPREVVDLFREVENARKFLRIYKELSDKIKKTGQDIKEWEDKSRDLLKEVGIYTDDKLKGDELITRFSGVLDKLNTRKDLFNTIKSRSTQIIESLGKGEDAESLLSELVGGEVQEWAKKTGDINGELGVIKKEIKDTTERLGENKKEREDLEKCTDIAKIETEIEGIQTEISEAVRKWRVISLAKAMVEETFNEFVRNRQPAVYEDASEYFKKVTNGRYPRVVYDLEAEEPAVFDIYSRRKKIKELSRGTREQLYLCIRLGLASEFARKGASLPLVMDDVLVNFDPERAKAMAKVLEDYSEKRQILLFTCHPGTIDIFKEAAPKTNEIKMEITGKSAGHPIDLLAGERL